jgi:hypothetical protein
MRKIAKFIWETWNLLKEFHEQHDFFFWCLLVVPTAISGVWAWLVRFNGLAIFLICLMALAAMAVLLAAIVVIKHWSGHEPIPRTPADQFTSAERLSAAASSTVTYLIPYEAIHYLADESQWGEEKADTINAEGMHYNALLEAPEEFQKRAAEGRIRVFGFNSGTRKHEEIDKTHWMSFGILPRVFRPGEDVRTEPTTLESAFYQGEGYSDLKITAADVYRTWPRSIAAEYRAEFDLLNMTKEEAVEALWRLRKLGVVIRNEHLSSEKEFAGWKAKYDKWREDVLAVADRFGEGLRPRLEVLDQVRQPPTLPAINGEHALDISVASEILLRLEERLP